MQTRPLTMAPPALLLALAAVAAPAGLDAQQQDTLRQDTVYEIEPIAVRAVRPSTTAGGVSAVEVRLDSVRFRAAPLLEHVLRELPLVQVRTNSRGEATIALRGAEERQIAVLVDGVPITLGWDHRTDLSVVPLTAAQRIQLIRGLSSLLHGPNVLGGVVEIDLASSPIPDPDPLRLAVGVDHTGGFSVGAVTGTALELDDARLTVRGGIGHRTTDGVPAPEDVDVLYPALAGDELVNSDMEHTDAFVSARYGAESGAWVSATASAFRSERGVLPELDQAEPRLWRYPETSRLLTLVAAGTPALENGLGSLELDLNLGVDLASTRIEDYLPPADPADPAASADDFFATINETEESDDRTVTARLVGEQRLPGGAMVGAAATVADILHDERITTGVATGSPTVFPAEYRQRLWSVAGEADLPFDLGLGPLTGGRVSAGLALDGASTLETGGSGEPGPSLTEWGGRVGLSATTSGGGLLLNTAVSRRGRFPALREMYSTALGRFAPNPDLQPEILTAIEAGFTTRFARYDVQVVGFHQRLDDAIVRGAPPAGSDARYQRVNRDRIRSTGVELLAGYTRGRFALETELTLQDVEVVEPGGLAVQAEYDPEVAGGVGGTVPLLAGFEAGAEVEFWGRQYCSSPRPGEEGYVALDPGTRADVQLARTFRLDGRDRLFRRIGVELAVDNVADSAVYDQCGLPQPGRTLRFQVRLD